MAKAIKLSIQNPCKQKASSFSKTKNGDFCSACQKEVIDFTQMSDRQVVDFFKNYKGNTCGKLKKNQLKSYTPQILNSPTVNASFKGIHLLGVSLLSLLPFTQVSAQQKTAVPTETIQNLDTRTTKPKELANIKPSKTDSLFSGVVREANYPAIGVNIVLEGSNVGTVSDFDGQFTFPKPLKVGDTLVFSSIGFETTSCVITNEIVKENFIEITLKFGEALMGEIVFMGDISTDEVYSPKRTLWQKISAFFQ